MLTKREKEKEVSVMDQYEYRKKQLERQRQLLDDMVKGVDYDPDIWNLKYMLTEIAPGSRAWRSGYIRSLRRAIRALERENKEKERTG